MTYILLLIFVVILAIASWKWVSYSGVSNLIKPSYFDGPIQGNIFFQALDLYYIAKGDTRDDHLYDKVDAFNPNFRKTLLNIANNPLELVRSLLFTSPIAKSI